MATYKSIPLPNIDASQGNLGEHDEGRYHPDNEDLQLLMDSLLSAGKGDAPLLISPITVVPTDNGNYSLVLGKRRWTALKLLTEQGYSVPGVDCRVLTKAQSEDVAFLAALKLQDDTTQVRISAFAEAVGTFELFEQRQKELTPEGEPYASNATVKNAMLAERGITPGNPRYDTELEKLTVTIRLFTATPAELVEACRKGGLGVAHTCRLNSKLTQVNAELESLEMPPIAVADLLAKLPEEYSLQTARSYLEEYLQNAQLEASKETLVKGLSEAIVAKVDAGDIPLKVLSEAIDQTQATPWETEEVLAIADEKRVEAEEAYPLTTTHVESAIKTLKDSFEIDPDLIKDKAKTLSTALKIKDLESWDPDHLRALLEQLNTWLSKVDTLKAKSKKLQEKKQKEALLNQATNEEAA